MPPEYPRITAVELQDPAVFAQGSVDREAGTIVWPNGADLDLDMLFEGGAPPTGIRVTTSGTPPFSTGLLAWPDGRDG